MNRQNSSISGRLYIVLGLLLLLPVGLVFQLARIQFVNGQELRDLWNEQTLDYISIPAKRGNIYDSQGRLLVTNSVGYKVAIDPLIRKKEQESTEKLINILTRQTSLTSRQLKNRINNAPRGSRYVVLAKQLGPKAYDAIKQLDLHSVILEEQYHRRYNFGSLASHSLGFVNHEMNGMIGLEASYNQKLKGEDGLRQIRRDRHGQVHSYVGAPTKNPEQGHSLYSTINSNIQAIVEEELREGIKRTRSQNGTAIVMNPQTGAIKAMANHPDFNPNRPAKSKKENRRNFAISNMVEPGSTFKLVTAIAAIEQDAVQFGEKFETPKSGRIKIHGQWMRDHEPLGTLTFQEVIEQSSNIATSQIAMRLEPKVFYQYIRNLGFGTATNIDLPNEKSGIVRKPYQWSQVTLPWLSIGYEVQVTPLQLVQAYAAFANEGKMMRPYMVNKIVDEEGNVVNRTDPLVVRRIAEKETIDRLTPIFEHVVSDSGTAPWAKVEGIRIAGKTGTAQKFKEGSYQTSYRSSFVGFFPVQNPKYVCLIMLDEPKTSIYGGYTAGPIFRHIAKRLIGLDGEIEEQYLKNQQKDESTVYAPSVHGLPLDQAKTILNSLNLSYKTVGSGKWVKRQQPEAGDSFKQHESITLYLANKINRNEKKKISDTHSRIPSVTGMSMRQAAALIHERGFQTQLIGSGVVKAQYPDSNQWMKKGNTVVIRAGGPSIKSERKDRR